MIICGIDYGSKLAGTTEIAQLDTATNSVHISGSQKGGDADKFIYISMVRSQPDYVFIDAPLSLPGVYSGIQDYHDYFFRQADKQLKAMSPMFLGGLTARAMKLKKELEALHVQVLETYPSAQAVRMNLHITGYKKAASAIPNIVHNLQQQLIPFTLENAVITNWHQVDALLALIGAIRFINNQYMVFGEAMEGLIIV